MHLLAQKGFAVPGNHASRTPRDQSDMEIKATLLPGQNGTKNLLRQYGDQLVCVRYRYDKANRKRYKTVELIIDEKDWIPNVVISSDKRVHVRVDYNEHDLRDLVKNSGGFWNPSKKAWQVPYRLVLQLGLEKRVLDEDFDF